MKPFSWDPDKNERLTTGRGISFEEIVLPDEIANNLLSKAHVVPFQPLGKPKMRE